MKSSYAIILSVFLIFKLGACATGPKIKPENPQSSVVGITVNYQTPITLPFMWYPADFIYFVKLSDGENILEGTNLIKANYSRLENLYLLNATPGRYIAVAAGYINQGTGIGIGPFSIRIDSEHVLLFPESLVKQTEVSVQSNQVCYMGQYNVRQNLSFSDLDATQTYYYDVVVPEHLGKEFKRETDMAIRHGSICEAKSAVKDEESEKKFLEATRSNFKGTDWAAILPTD